MRISEVKAEDKETQAGEKKDREIIYIYIYIKTRLRRVRSGDASLYESMKSFILL